VWLILAQWKKLNTNRNLEIKNTKPKDHTLFGHDGGDLSEIAPLTAPTAHDDQGRLSAAS
jgi:hypothetical protein